MKPSEARATIYTEEITKYCSIKSKSGRSLEVVRIRVHGTAAKTDCVDIKSIRQDGKFWVIRIPAHAVTEVIRALQAFTFELERNIDV